MKRYLTKGLQPYTKHWKKRYSITLAKYRYEVQVNYLDGSNHDVVLHKNTYENTDGEVTGLVGAFIDITERKIAEEALSQALINAEQQALCLTLLNQLATALSLGPDQQSAFKAIAERTKQIFNIDRCSIELFDENDSQQVDIFVLNGKDGKLPIGSYCFAPKYRRCQRYTTQQRVATDIH